MYYLDDTENNAYVIGVHVAAYDRLRMNAAVPICLHVTTTDKEAITATSKEEAVLQPCNGNITQISSGGMGESARSMN